MDQFMSSCRCRGGARCPEVRCSGDQIWIKDDAGHIVTMSVVELLDICTTIVDEMQSASDALEK